MTAEHPSTHTHTHTHTRRDPQVDLLKAAAVLGVVMIHVSAGGLGAPAGSRDWLACLFWDCAARGSVPLFLMCSGALLLPPERELSLKKLYTRNLPRLLTALLVWAGAYKLVGLDGLSAAGLVQAGKELLLFRHETHLYYLHIMLLVYAFLPLTRALVRAADRTTLRYGLALWFLLGILYPTVKPYWPFTLLAGIPAQWLMNMTYAAVGYTVLGWYLSVYPLRRRYSAAAFLAGLAWTFGGTWAASLAQGALYEHLMEGMSVGPFLLAAGAYGLGRQLRLPPWAVRWTERVSRASFCIFLVHVFFLRESAALGLTARTGPALLTVPLLSTAILLCGLAVYGVLSRVPAARDWLV